MKRLILTAALLLGIAVIADAHVYDKWKVTHVYPGPLHGFRIVDKHGNEEVFDCSALQWALLNSHPVHPNGPIVRVTDIDNDLDITDPGDAVTILQP